MTEYCKSMEQIFMNLLFLSMFTSLTKFFDKIWHKVLKFNLALSHNTIICSLLQWPSFHQDIAENYLSSLGFLYLHVKYAYMIGRCWCKCVLFIHCLYLKIKFWVAVDQYIIRSLNIKLCQHPLVISALLFLHIFLCPKVWVVPIMGEI